MTMRYLASPVLAIAALLALSAAPAQATEHCENEASRQGPSVNLPECRVYEQVTPVDKGDAVNIFGSRDTPEKGIVAAEGNQAYVAEDGDGILVYTDGSFAADASASASAYVFSREAGGWGMNVLAQPIAASQEVGEHPEFLFDPRDLSAVGFNDEVGTLSELLGGDQSAFRQMELVGPVGGTYSPLFSLSGFPALTSEEQISMVGGSEDLSRVILQGEDHSLAAGAEEQDAGTDAIYETAGGGECGQGTSSCRLVNVNLEGRAMPCGAVLGLGGKLQEGKAYSAVSSDGSRIFFTAPEPAASGPGCWNPGMSGQENPPELYVREGGSRTVEISAPEASVTVGTTANPLSLSVFVGASADGSKVFFLTKMALTKGAVEGDVGHTPELYEYNMEPREGEKALTLISGGPSGTLEGDVENVTAVSSDGSAVYFSAYGNLATGASQYPPGTEALSPVNLYRHDTVTGETTYITKLVKFDYPAAFGRIGEWYTPQIGGPGGDAGIEDEGVFDAKEWYTTGGGRFLLFGTSLPLTSFDNRPAPGVECPNSYPQDPNPGRCFELYRYDAVSGQIVCVSCAGGAPVNGAYFARTNFESAAVGPPRPISEDGEDVFFESANALVPQAVPGKNHVYEWHGGVISLISSPSDPGSAFFLGSSADGSNVFFVTHAQLSAADTDQASDIYDARVGGGFVGVVPPACTGTGCQGVPAAPPVFATPASATFAGVGNFPAPVASNQGLVKTGSKAKPKKCAKGKKLSRGKCVTVKAKRREKARR